ncbi:DNA polymerase zeta catalytic subunit [Linum perenne]
MADSQSNSEVFSVRIVSIDFYTSPPVPGVDVCYSSFQGGNVNEVPVIRVYGSTPAGQKTCLHIHGVLPYLYVPCSDIPLDLRKGGDAYTSAMSVALEKALKLRGSAGSKRQHVHCCTLVRAKKFYGYHSSEEMFVKIYLYYPHDVSRAAGLLLDGAVLDKSMQPYESHIPFLLQFLVDYNLSGMGFVHVSKVKFRHPVPDVFSKRKSNQNAQESTEMEVPLSGHSEADLRTSQSLESPVWISSTIPGGWTWQTSSEYGTPSDQYTHLVKRKTVCELEGDATVDDILNQQLKLYTSLSQTGSDAKMVQSLIPIWEEEYERTGMQEAAMPPDPGKPLPQDVLNALSHNFELNKKLVKLACKAEDDSMLIKNTEEDPPSVTFVNDEKLVELGNTGANDIGKETSKSSTTKENVELLSPQDSMCQEELFQTPIEGKYGCLGSLSADEEQSLETIELEPKVTDTEALDLLKWLASSQAAEEINSDDELARETILSPLVPSATLDKVLERANLDYENASQRECQDIIDSVEDFVEHDGSKEKLSHSLEHNCYSTPEEKISKSSCSNLTNKRKKSLWGTLPFSAKKTSKPISAMPNISALPDGEYKSEKDGRGCADVHTGAYQPYALGECSVRDLMRKKRCHQISQHKNLATFDSRKGFMDLRMQLDDDLAKSSVQSVDTGMPVIKEPNDLLPDMGNPLVVGSDKDSVQRASNGLKQSPSMFGFHSVNNIDERSECVGGTPEVIASDLNYVPDSPENGLPSMFGLHSIGNIDERSEYIGGTPEAIASELNYVPDSPDNGLNDYTTLSDLRLLKMVDNTAGSSCLSVAPPIDLENHETQYLKDRGPTKSGIHSGKLFEKSTQNVICKEESVDATILTCEAVCSATPKHGSYDFFADGSSVSKDVNVEREPTGLYRMTFRKKPPAADLKDGASRIASSSHPTIPSVKKDGKSVYKLPPFFERRHNNKIRHQSRSGMDVDREAVIGVPTYYQNDGSILYLLTPAFSPPSRDVVCRWLAREKTAISENDPKNCSVRDDTAVPLQSNCVSHLTTTPDQVQKETSHGLDAENHPCQEKLQDPSQSEGDMRDASQISGPDGRSGPTPLSQIGFRDPASSGGGQQLTLLSMEVQAESRGDLRPDPRFDAVNIVALAFRDDSDCASEVYVLVHSNCESSRGYSSGISGHKVLVFPEEKLLFKHLFTLVRSFDPDVLIGWDIQSGSIGFLAERAGHLGLSLLGNISRTPFQTGKDTDAEAANKSLSDTSLFESFAAGSELVEDAIIEDEWGRTHASGVHVTGRIVLNVWRLVRSEVKLNLYTIEAVSEAVLRRKTPSIPYKVLSRWFASGIGRGRYRCIEFLVQRVNLNLEIVDQLDMVNRTSELARVFGIDFFSVLSRGSQYRVESMLLRLAHTQNYVAISPGSQQVASQPAMECVPLVMEPESGFYADPVVVLDFQSLYPSMIIAYNLCFCTCLGNVEPSKADTLGVTSFSPDPEVLQSLVNELLVTPNSVMYAPSQVRKGILPRLLEEILSTRIMVKQAMKKLGPNQQILHRIFNARQLALKLIANVTYGYTAAGFSGRMPCAEIADSIVQCGRSTLEKAIALVNNNNKWKARVVYGDTDSMFVLLQGRTVAEAHRIGNEIASAVTAMNPHPVTLKMEKVYQPCFLLTKKRYVGYSYERADQSEPVFDAKGIETVRRDTCTAVAKMMEQSIRLFFEQQDISKVKSYLHRQWTRILSGRVSLQDFIFAKEVRLGSYSTRSASSLPPAAIVATKAMRSDPRAEPRYGERVPYVVIHGEPGARLIDMVVDPLTLLALNSPYRLNDVYYITKQIIPALQRVFGLVGADLNRWFAEMPRPARGSLAKHRPQLFAPNQNRMRIDYYYLSQHCLICGELVRSSAPICGKCMKNEAAVATAVVGRTSKLEREMHHLAAICRQCGGGDWVVEAGIKCNSLACSVFYERRKVQKELMGLTAVATERGMYPKCTVEWF